MSKLLNRNVCFQSKKHGVVLFVSALLLSSFLTLAQSPEPVFRKYTVDDGLPSSVVYHVFQDSKGYIWFATANGVSRYDGYNFENFDIQSGLVDNEVFEIYEDYKHRIWFIPMSGKLSYFENGKIVSYKYNSKIKGHLPTSRGPIKCSFYVDSLDYVYLGLKQFGLIRISPEGVFKNYADEEAPDISLNLFELPNGKILISNHKNSKNKTIIFHGLHQDFKISMDNLIKDGQVTHHHLFFLSMPDSSMVCSFVESIYKFKNGKIKSRKNYRDDGIIWMSADANNNLWVAPIGGGIQCFSNYDISKEPITTFLKNIQVSSVLIDKEGAYWFSSLKDGVFYCSSINLLNYTTENGLADNRINAVCANSKEVYIGYDFGFVDKFQNGKITHYNTVGKKAYNPSVRSISIDPQSDRVWVCAIDSLYWIHDNHVSCPDPEDIQTSIYPRKIVKSKYFGYWVGTTRGLFKYYKNKLVYNSYLRNDFFGLIYDLVEDYDGTVWFCSINGLWKYSNGNFLYLGSENPLLAQASNSIIQNPRDSSLWIGTNGAGIIVKGKKKIYQITKEDGLISNSVHQLFYHNNNIWVATRQGLSRIILEDGVNSIKNYTNANGLPTNEVSSVCESENKVYVGTTKGLTVFEKENIDENRTPPNIIISNFRVNNVQIDLTSTKIDLDYYQNSLKFDFVGFVYRKEGSVQYRYRMLGVDTNWVQTQTPNCLYIGLPNGNYKFEVAAQSYNGVWSTKPAYVSFTIQPQFWKRTWFLILGSIIFSSIIFIVFRVRVNTINRRNNLIQNINLYKQQSLRQQMNPHFIFNTLNSIQLYILERDPISSHKYLTKFARLMRMTLDNSLNSTIPLRDEIEALKLYLDLEKLRLEGKFEYSIEFGKYESILDYKIPTLLIQPFVENAIWHGITLKQDQSGWVRIVLQDMGNSIYCTIEDNGIGREMAGNIRKQNKKGHTSRGSQITQQRIDLLSLMYKEKFNIYYEDLFDEQGISKGTKVFITIPKEINAHIQM